MHILFIPKGTRKGHITSLGASHMAIMFISVIILTIVFGVTSYRIYLLVNNQDVNYALSQIDTQTNRLDDQQNKLSYAKNNAETHLLALTKQLGTLQAQMLRLDALGERLTQMAKIDNEEFHFGTISMGENREEAPNKNIYHSEDFIAYIAELNEQIASQQAQLLLLKEKLSDNRIDEVGVSLSNMQTNR